MYEDNVLKLANKRWLINQAGVNIYNSRNLKGLIASIGVRPLINICTIQILGIVIKNLMQVYRVWAKNKIV